jgi:hypothetical protein
MDRQRRRDEVRREVLARDRIFPAPQGADLDERGLQDLW